MRKHIFVRPATPDDAATFLDWARANSERNAFDPFVAAYPNTITLCAYDQDGPLAYLPLQQPLLFDTISGNRPVSQQPMFLEGLAMRPGSDKHDVSRALKELVQAAVTLGHIQGRGEIYFLGTDAATDHLAANQLFERLEYPVYRLRMADLEKKPCV